LFPELFRHSKRKNRTVADALTGNTWVRDIDHDMSQRIIEEYLQLWDKLEHVVLTQSDEDRIIWTHSSSGEYSAKSAYDLHFHNLDRCSVAELIWKTKAPPKCRFFIWLLLQDRLWTAARLQVRHWPNEYFCQLCIRNLETADHLFVECPVVKTIWHRLGLRVGALSLQPENWELVDNVSVWFTQMMNRLPSQLKEGLRSLILLTIWEIWRERNGRIFRKECRQVQKIVESIYDEANTWARAGNKGLRLVLQMQINAQGNGAGQMQINAQGNGAGQPSSANVMVVSPSYVI
jgi:hypothetical protein